LTNFEDILRIHTPTDAYITSLSTLQAQKKGEGETNKKTAKLLSPLPEGGRLKKLHNRTEKKWNKKGQKKRQSVQMKPK